MDLAVPGEIRAAGPGRPRHAFQADSLLGPQAWRLVGAVHSLGAQRHTRATPGSWQGRQDPPLLPVAERLAILGSAPAPFFWRQLLQEGLHRFPLFSLGEKQVRGLAGIGGEIEELAGSKANVVSKPKIAADVVTTYADISKARRLLGYNPQVSVAEGVQRFWEWYRDNS